VGGITVQVLAAVAHAMVRVSCARHTVEGFWDSCQHAATVPAYTAPHAPVVGHGTHSDTVHARTMHLRCMQKSALLYHSPGCLP
jgi:hypothetical protein